jgi:hypothetical protein
MTSHWPEAGIVEPSMRVFLKRIFLTPVLVLLVAGCGGDDPVVADIQILNAVPDTSVASFTFNQALNLGNFDFRQGSNRFSLHARDYSLTVLTQVVGVTVTLLDDVNVPLLADESYTLALIGRLNDSSVKQMLIPGSIEPVGADNIRVQAVNLAPGAPSYDVYVTTPGADLTASAPLGGVAFREFTEPVEMPSGDYQIRVTVSGDPSTVVHDTGTLIFTAEGLDLVLALVENTRMGLGPVSLVIHDTVNPIEILDVAATANLRAIHLAPAVDPAVDEVDIVLDDDLANPLISGLTFPTVTSYNNLASANYNIKSVDTPTQSIFGIDIDVPLIVGTDYTLLAFESVDAAVPMQGLVLLEDSRGLGFQAKIRFVNGAPSEGSIDIYVLLPGETIDDFVPSVPNVVFQFDAGYSLLPAGDFEITATVAGDRSQIVIPTIPVTLDSGGVYTYVARDAAGGGAPLDWIALTDNPGF